MTVTWQCKSHSLKCSVNLPVDLSYMLHPSENSLKIQMKSVHETLPWLYIMLMVHIPCRIRTRIETSDSGFFAVQSARLTHDGGHVYCNFSVFVAESFLFLLGPFLLFSTTADLLGRQFELVSAVLFWGSDTGGCWLSEVGEGWKVGRPEVCVGDDLVREVVGESNSRGEYWVELSGFASLGVCLLLLVEIFSWFETAATVNPWDSAMKGEWRLLLPAVVLTAPLAPLQLPMAKLP